MIAVQNELWEGLPSPSPSPTGEDLRDEGTARVSTNAPEEWVALCDAIIRQLARSGEEFTAEEVRIWTGNPPHPNALGARFLVASKANLIRRVGYRNATRPEAHARVLRVYQGAK
jgi:hypothetical protein